MLIRKMNDVEAQPITIDGAKNTTIRVVFGPQQQAPTFALRHDIRPGSVLASHKPARQAPKLARFEALKHRYTS